MLGCGPGRRATPRPALLFVSRNMDAYVALFYEFYFGQIAKLRNLPLEAFSLFKQ